VLAVGDPQTTSPGWAEVRTAPVEWVGSLSRVPHSGREVRRIAALFEPASRVLARGNATEEAVRKAARGDVSILHFATHALVDEDRPERSGLALSRGPGPSDGILQTREIYALELQGALVTLSACQTALGREVTGEGLVGLSRAFFYAGARAVTATLWNVGDRSTSDLMEIFYRQIRRGAPPERALAEAKRTVLRRGSGRRHPYYWAPFIVMGHTREAVEFPDPPPPFGLWSGAAAATSAAAAAIAVIAARRRPRRTAAGTA
jgi:CHAT domain-containing protein